MRRVLARGRERIAEESDRGARRGWKVTALETYLPSAFA
jgi:hypothetical protein